MSNAARHRQKGFMFLWWATWHKLNAGLRCHDIISCHQQWCQVVYDVVTSFLAINNFVGWLMISWHFLPLRLVPDSLWSHIINCWHLHLSKIAYDITTAIASGQDVSIVSYMLLSLSPKGTKSETTIFSTSFFFRFWWLFFLKTIGTVLFNLSFLVARQRHLSLLRTRVFHSFITFHF